MVAHIAWLSTLCVLLLSRLLEAVPDEPYFLPDKLCSVVVRRAASSTFVYIVQSSNKETIDSFLISPPTKVGTPLIITGAKTNNPVNG